MPELKIFHRKTKRGSIVKIVREHYLRDDILCGLKKCDQCYPTKILDEIDTKIYLSPNGRSNMNQLISESHVLLPDVSVFSEQMDTIEDAAFIENLIILQSVRNDIRSRNLSLYSRMKDLNKDRQFVFINEYHRDTYTRREPGETTTDYNFRVVIKAAQWYRDHLSSHGLTAVLLVNDDSLRDRARSEYNLRAYTIIEYVEKLRENSSIVDKLVRKEANEENVDPGDGKKFIYPEHLPLNQIQVGIKNGNLHQAKYQTSRENYLEGFVAVNINGESTRILIQGRENINRAVHDDIVAVDILPKEQWKSRMEVILVEDIDREDRDEEEKTENVEQVVSGERVPTGKVVGIVKRNWRQYCGVLRHRSENLMSSLLLTTHFFVPVERRIPIVRIETRQYETLKNQRIVVAIDNWPRNSRYPKGHYVRCLGGIGEKETENEMLLLEHDVPHEQFSKAVLKCLPDPSTFVVTEKELRKRKDLRSKFICSVDPPGCTDIDDALHCDELGNGLLEIGVHIADVSWFVKPGTALDTEAANRGTTVYLVDKRIHMLPSVISTNLCSLIENQERLTFSVIWKIRAQTGEIVDTWFGKSVIKSKASLTYAEAQMRIDSSDDDRLTQGLRNLNSIAKILKGRRLEQGALVLANGGEIRFIEVESETHDNMTEIESKQLKETNSMVEEFMLLANISVACKLFEDLPQLALLRCHPKPSPANFDELIRAGKSRNFEIDVSDGKSLSHSLNSAVDSRNSYVNVMMRMITTRCMTQATYFCSGKVSDPSANFGHFGLATPMYTHFTSPIRRYADLIVHRQLSHALGVEMIDSSLVSADKVASICENINYRHRQAQLAGRASVKIHTILFIRNARGSVIEEGFVLYVKANALSIFIPRIAFETTYFFDDIEQWIFDVEKNQQLYKPKNIIIRQFDRVKIELKLVDKSNEFRKGNEVIEVKLIDPHIDVEMVANKIEPMVLEPLLDKSEDTKRGKKKRRK